MGDKIDNLVSTAAIGCGLGVLWGVANGEIRFKKGKDFYRASMACAGNAISSVGIEAIADYYTDDPKIPDAITKSYWALQAASNSLLWVGDKLSLNRDPLYNAVLATTSYLTTPAFSSAGFVYGLGGSIYDGFEHTAVVKGGMIGFPYKACPMTPFNLGITGHCTEKEASFWHEQAHMKQQLIMGDLGYAGVLALDYTWQLLLSIGSLNPMPLMRGPGGFSTEPWAEDIDH